MRIVGGVNQERQGRRLATLSIFFTLLYLLILWIPCLLLIIAGTESISRERHHTTPDWVRFFGASWFGLMFYASNSR